MIDTLLFIIFVAAGYFSGSLCSAVMVSNVFDLPDPRSQGSKNPGATNVLRLSGKKYALIVLITDMLKGFLPVFLCLHLTNNILIASFVCLAAVLGHMYPVFFKFKGGKGVATAIGGLFGLHFMLGVVSTATWLIVANFSGFSSLASIAAMLLTPFYAIVMLKNLDPLPPLSLVALLILFQHRENITRLMDGTESKIKLRHDNITDITDQLLDKPTETKVRTSSATEKTSQAAKVLKTTTTKSTAQKKAPAKSSKSSENTAKKTEKKQPVKTKVVKKKKE